MIISLLERQDITINHRGEEVELVLFPHSTTTDDSANRWSREDSLMIRMSLNTFKQLKKQLCPKEP
jgi:hypothetical protein